MAMRALLTIRSTADGTVNCLSRRSGVTPVVHVDDHKQEWFHSNECYVGVDGV